MRSTATAALVATVTVLCMGVPATQADLRASASPQPVVAHTAALRTKRTKVRIRLPARGRTRVARKTIRVHKRLKQRQVRRRRVGRFELYMRVRGPNGRLGPKLGPGRTGLLTNSNGRVVAAVGFETSYNPRRGLLRYRIVAKNVGFGRRAARRGLRAQLTSRYRF